MRLDLQSVEFGHIFGNERSSNVINEHRGQVGKLGQNNYKMNAEE